MNKPELVLHVGVWTYTLGHDRYVRRDDSVKILGRCSGNAPGAYWYQIAAKPYDEMSVDGLASLSAAFAGIVNELERRRKRS